MIPQEKSAAVTRGLRESFGVTEIEDIRMMTKGHTSSTDFVEAAPFPVTDALVRMPTVLRTLHALTPFPSVPNHINTSCMLLLNKGTAVDGFIRSFQAANILPKDESEQLFAWYAHVAAVYPHHNPDLSSHNDLFKPDISFSTDTAYGW